MINSVTLKTLPVPPNWWEISGQCCRFVFSQRRAVTFSPLTQMEKYRRRGFFPSLSLFLPESREDTRVGGGGRFTLLVLGIRPWSCTGWTMNYILSPAHYFFSSGDWTQGLPIELYHQWFLIFIFTQTLPKLPRLAWNLSSSASASYTWDYRCAHHAWTEIVILFGAWGKVWGRVLLCSPGWLWTLDDLA